MVYWNELPIQTHCLFTTRWCSKHCEFTNKSWQFPYTSICEWTPLHTAPTGTIITANCTFECACQVFSAGVKDKLPTLQQEWWQKYVGCCLLLVKVPKSSAKQAPQVTSFDTSQKKNCLPGWFFYRKECNLWSYKIYYFTPWSRQYRWDIHYNKLRETW